MRLALAIAAAALLAGCAGRDDGPVFMEMTPQPGTAQVMTEGT